MAPLWIECTDCSSSRRGESSQQKADSYHLLCFEKKESTVMVGFSPCGCAVVNTCFTSMMQVKMQPRFSLSNSVVVHLFPGRHDDLGYQAVHHDDAVVLDFPRLGELRDGEQRRKVHRTAAARKRSVTVDQLPQAHEQVGGHPC